MPEDLGSREEVRDTLRWQMPPPRIARIEAAPSPEPARLAEGKAFHPASFLRLRPRPGAGRTARRLRTLLAFAVPRPALVLSYLAIFALAVALMLDFGGLEEEPSVPALAPSGPSEPLVPWPRTEAIEPPGTLLEKLWYLVADPRDAFAGGWRKALCWAVPGLEAWTDVQAGRVPRGGADSSRLPLLLAFFVPEPQAFLCAIPGLADSGAGRELFQHGAESPAVSPGPNWGGTHRSDGASETGQPPVVREGDLSVYGSGEPLVGIYHTHTSEAYLPDIRKASGGKMTFDDAHSHDPEMNMVYVGRILAEALVNAHGIPVAHSSAVHDADGKQGAYTPSLATAQRMLGEHRGIRVLLDLHRDAQPRSLTTAEVGGKPVSRVMVVLGTSQSLPHPGWKRNYEFAMAFAGAMERKYPGLSLGVLPSTNRYNQHLLPGALLLEIGGVENSLEESARTAVLLADVIADLFERGEVPERGS